MATEKREAGRVLDVEIAERVMGTTGIGPQRRLSHRGWADDIGTVRDYTMPDGRLGREATRLPCYSTDVAAAFAVVDAMRAKGWFFSGENEERWGKPWTAWFNRGKSEEEICWEESEKGDADTLPLAICLAALAALDAAPLSSQSEP